MRLPSEETWRKEIPMKREILTWRTLLSVLTIAIFVLVLAGSVVTDEHPKSEPTKVEEQKSEHPEGQPEAKKPDSEHPEGQPEAGKQKSEHPAEESKPEKPKSEQPTEHPM
jgi:hypothetical protein